MWTEFPAGLIVIARPHDTKTLREYDCLHAEFAVTPEGLFSSTNTERDTLINVSS